MKAFRQWCFRVPNPTLKDFVSFCFFRIQELMIKGEARGVAKTSRRHVLALSHDKSGLGYYQQHLAADHGSAAQSFHNVD